MDLYIKKLTPQEIKLKKFVFDNLLYFMSIMIDNIFNLKLKYFNYFYENITAVIMIIVKNSREK